MGGDAIDVFLEQARRYCLLIESADDLGRGEFVWRTGDQLARLYAAAVDLPETEPGDSDDASRELSGGEVSALQERLSAKLGDLDEYRFIFDPWDAKDEPVVGRLSDDLSDIYRELKDGLTAHAGVDPQDALWELRFSFGNHWGVHAGHAMYAIHWLTRAAGQKGVEPGDA